MVRGVANHKLGHERHCFRRGWTSGQWITGDSSTALRAQPMLRSGFDQQGAVDDPGQVTVRLRRSANSKLRICAQTFEGKRMIAGGCLCGAIKYEIDSPLQFARNCHCSMCRTATGAAFATWAYVEVSNFRWVQGEGQLGRYQSSAEVTRTFCKVCGSTMQYLAKQAFQGAFGLALGTVDGDPGCTPMRHVMVASKAAWFEITDHLPQSQEAAPSE